MDFSSVVARAGVLLGVAGGAGVLLVVSPVMRSQASPTVSSCDVRRTPATQTSLSSPLGVGAASDGTFFIADTEHQRVLRVATDGTVGVVAGTGARSVTGQDPEATRLVSPAGVAVSSDGSVIVSDVRSHRVWRILPDGRMVVVAGTGSAGFSGDGGLGANAELREPVGVAVTPTGAILIADRGNARVRRVSPEGTIATVAGGGDQRPAKHEFSVATESRLVAPSGVTASADEGFLIADAGSHVVWRVSSDEITSVAGTGNPGYQEGTGPALERDLNTPMNVAMAADGGFLIADTDNQRVRKVARNGALRTVAGSGTFGVVEDGARAVQADLAWPTGLAALDDGSFLISDTGANVVLRRCVDGGMHIVAGVLAPKPHSLPAGAAAETFRAHLLHRAIRVGATCKISTPYTTNKDGTGHLKLAGREHRWKSRIWAPDGRFAVKLGKLRKRTYTVMFFATRTTTAERTRSDRAILRLKKRCT